MNSRDKILQKLDNLENKIESVYQQKSIPLWLTIEQTSDYLNLGKSTVRRLVSNEEIPYTRVGSTKRILINRKRTDLWLLTGDKAPKKRARKLNKDFIYEGE